MNKFRVVGLVIMFFLLTTGCGSNTPRGAAQKFTEHLWRADLRGAEKYASEKTRARLDAWIEWGRHDVEANFKVKRFKFVLIKETIDGDKAEILYNSTWIGEKDNRSIHLTKEDGQWKVNEPEGNF